MDWLFYTFSELVPVTVIFISIAISFILGNVFIFFVSQVLLSLNQTG